MVGYSIILVLSIFAALLLGFYFGFLKQHNKEPYNLKQTKDIATSIFESIKEPKEPKEPEPDVEELKENQFFR